MTKMPNKRPPGNGAWASLLHIPCWERAVPEQHCWGAHNMNAPHQRVLRFGMVALLGLMSGCVPTMSMHSYRNVAITITKADGGEPVPSLPFRVIYEYNPVDGPIYHVELRTPHEVRAETDENGEAVVKLADYAWGVRVEVNAKDRGYSGLFWLSKDLIRKGGVVEQERYPYPDLPKLRLDLHPTKRPTRVLHWTPGAHPVCMRLPSAPAPVTTDVRPRGTHELQ